MERSISYTETADEPPVKVSKSQKLLNLLVAVRCRPICHSTNFSRIHLHSSRSYIETQEGDSVGMKHTFFSFDIQVIV